MHLQILGCGTIIQADSAYNCSGYLIDRNLLFDCGPGVWRALHKYQIPLVDIGHIFISHFHVDHCADLAPVLQENYINDPEKEKTLYLHGPPGLRHWFERFTQYLGRWAAEMPVLLNEFDGGIVRFADYTVESGLTGHTENSICFRLEKGGTSFFYSGDTGQNENIVNLAAGCHLALIEASHNEKNKQDGHLTPEQTAQIAARASVQKLCLTHMYPEVRTGDPIGNAARFFSGEIFLAEDGMNLHF